MAVLSSILEKCHLENISKDKSYKLYYMDDIVILRLSNLYGFYEI